jgi:hypothetical protein
MADDGGHSFGTLQVKASPDADSPTVNLAGRRVNGCVKILGAHGPAYLSRPPGGDTLAKIMNRYCTYGS